MSETKNKQPGRVKSALLNWLGVPVSLVDGSFWAEWSGAKNYAGKTVTVNSALQLSAAWACVRLISETLSTLPLNLYDDSGQAKTMARDHPLYRLLHTQPNADMTAAVFWQAYVASLLLWGNAYVEIHRSGGAITSLEFLLPQFVTRKRTSSGAVEWSYADPFAKVTRKIAEAQMWHTPAFTTDGVTGLSPIALGANVIGSAMAADEASAHTFKNGMKAAGLVTMDAVLKPEQREDVRQHVRKVSADGGVMVLEKGSAFQQLTMNPQDAELLSTRSFNVEEICRWFRVPPFMVGHSEKSTSWGTGIEQQMIGFVTFVLRPWCVRIEQSIRKSLMTPAEKQRYQAEFAMEGLLRGDSAARGQFYSTMVQNGIYTRNNVRRLENLEPVEGGDELTVQSNMIPIGMLGQGTTAQDALKNWLGIEDKT
ncbi:phage portal protein [Alcaligenes faecalis]|uniref:phage portal protein n=1 Tax=Alcaligenes faecalis TaxID=511 RepID=UPI001293EA45|nr:phage portal protein [Alcaligenes faecalis]QFY77365.1 phage portal protein [Alcaligenes faecalis]